jgi:hypothetical protein
VLILNAIFLDADAVRELEGVLTKFPNNDVIGVLVAPSFSKEIDDEVLSSKFSF